MDLCVSSRPLSTRSSSSLLMNLMMSDENNRDIYITILSMPPTVPCTKCCPVPTSMTVPTGGETKHSLRSGCLVARNPFPPDCFCIFSPQGTGSAWITAMCSTAGTRWSIRSPPSSLPSSLRRTKLSCSTPATLWWPVESHSAQVAPARTRVSSSGLCSRHLNQFSSFQT